MQETWETWVPFLGQEDSPGGGHGNSLQYSCLETPMDRGHDWRDLACTHAWIDTQAGPERQSLGCILVADWITLIGHFFRFPSASHFGLPGPEAIFGVSQEPPTCACSSLSQDGFYQRGSWVADITSCEVTSPPFLTSKEPFYLHVVEEVSLTLRVRNMWSFMSYLGRAQPPPSSCFCGVSTWGPSVSCLRPRSVPGPSFSVPLSPPAHTHSRYPDTNTSSAWAWGEGGVGCGIFPSHNYCMENIWMSSAPTLRARGGRQVPTSSQVPIQGAGHWWKCPLSPPPLYLQKRQNKAEPLLIS